MSDSHSAVDVLVVGGGLAGAAAAMHLARGGRQVTLLEREASPRHKVCGEFLSTEALTLLRTLGIAPDDHGALAIGHVRLCSGRHITTAALPFAARSLTRRCLDDLALRAINAAGVDVRRGTAVEGLRPDGDQWQLQLQHGTTLRAPHVLLASGKHDLRGLPRPAGVQGDLVALKMYWQLAPAETAALAGHVELLLHPHGYTGLQLVEGEKANLCALVRRSHLATLQGWQGLLRELCEANPHAARRLHGAKPLLPKPLAIAPIPYGFVRRHALAPGLWAIGDQAAVIPSFTGDGMSLALYTGLRAAEALLAGETTERFQARLGHELRPQVLRATTLSRALVHPGTQGVAAGVAHRWPALLPWAARTTRLAHFGKARAVAH